MNLVVSLLLAIPLAIIANMLTPTVQRWWANTSEKRRVKRIEKLKAELNRLTGVNGSSQPSAKLPTTPHPFTKQPSLSAVFGGSWAVKGVTAYIVVYHNVEDRYPTTAYNLAASLLFTPFHGQKVTVPKTSWVYGTEAVNARSLCAGAVDIGMTEHKSVIILVSQDQTFYSPRYIDTHGVYDEMGVVPDQRLEYGEWTIQIRIDGDNYQCENGFKLKLMPNGTMSWSNP